MRCERDLESNSANKFDLRCKTPFSHHIKLGVGITSRREKTVSALVSLVLLETLVEVSILVMGPLAQGRYYIFWRLF